MPVSTSMSVTVNVSATATDSHRQRRMGPGPEPRAKCPTFAEALRHSGTMAVWGIAALWTARSGFQPWLNPITPGPCQ